MSFGNIGKAAAGYLLNAVLCLCSRMQRVTQRIRSAARWVIAGGIK